MKCLLISPQTNAYVTGLKYIAANVRDKGHDARILLLPAYLEETLHPTIEDFIVEYNPDLIGISLMSIEFYSARNLTRLLRERFQIPIIWGGVHVSTYPEECIKYADYVCRGEGESTVVSLLEHLRNNGKEVLPDIPNIWVRYNGRIIKQSSASLETNLDSLPFQEYLPDYYYGFHKGKIYNFAKNPHLFRRYALYGGTCHMMITTRGCPFNCSYCGHTALISVYGRKVRERSVENCLKELRAVKKDPYVLYINFEDDCFFVHKKEWIKEFCKEYKRHINLPFIVRAFPTMLDKEKLFMLKDAGLSIIVMGIQSGSDRVNYEIYNRRIPFSSAIKATEIISEAKAVPFCEMIVDNPYETEETEMETIDSMSRLKKPYIISLAHLTFFPGTPLTEKAIKDNITTHESSLYIHMTSQFNETYLNKLLRITPYIPRAIARYLNKPEKSRGHIHSLLTNILYAIIRRTIEPAIFMFLIARSVNYNIKLTIRTLMGNWRSALSKLIFNYLGMKDIEYTKRLVSLRKTMPALFEND